MVAELFAAASRLTEDRVRELVLERLVEPNLLLPGRVQPGAIGSRPYENLNWGIAAVSPVPSGELDSIVRRHAQWLQREALRRRWTNVVIDSGELAFALYHGPTDGQATLTHRDLRGANLANKSLAGANFLGSIVDDALFARADLRQACATNLHGHRASFVGADLRGTDFSRSDLRNASFRDAICEGVDFEECDLTGCDFTGVDLGRAKVVRAKRP